MYHNRRLSDLTVEDFWKSMEQVFEQKLEDIFKKYMPELKEYLETVKANERHWTTKEVCEKLKISRQTLINWYKKPNTNVYLKQTRTLIGNKYLYQLPKIKEIIKSNENAFIRGRTYEYQSNVFKHEPLKLNASTEEILEKNYEGFSLEEIENKYFKGGRLTKEEMDFYKMKKVSNVVKFE